MPELIPFRPPASPPSSNEILMLQTKLLDLKKKLILEKQMHDAAKLIKVRMSKERNVQQVVNSLNEYVERIEFIEQQIKEVEHQILGFKQQEIEQGKEASIASYYLDAVDSVNISSSPSILNEQNSTNDLKYLLANEKLSWSKIDYKISDLSCRLKINENILEAEEKIIEAYKAGKAEEIRDLVEGKELSRQKVQILQQSLKKYTSLISSEPGTTPTSEDNCSGVFGHGNSQLPQFTGKLMIKVTKIGGFTVGRSKIGGFTIGRSSNPSISLNFNLNQFLSPSSPPNNFHPKAKTTNSSVSTTITSTSKDPENSTIFTCYQEIVVNLVKASELELTISTASGPGIKGMFFAKLATLLRGGPDVEASLSQSFEIEPTGIIDLQFHYTPDKLKKNQLNKERIARIERRPVIKRTQHLIKGHELISTNFFQLLKCSYCQEMIMNTSGYQCKLCKLICHRKCYSKLFEKCLYSEDEINRMGNDEINTMGNNQTNTMGIIDQFTSKYNIPHHQKLVSVAIPSWCAHCGHILPLGRKINYKCEECSIVWHDRCDPHICKTHCGLNSDIVENYLVTMENVKKDQEQKVKRIRESKSSENNKSKIAEISSSESPLKSRKLRIEDFELIKCIGKGNFGKVMLAKYRGDNGGTVNAKYFAIKMLKKHSIVENEEYESLKTEKKIFEIATKEGHPFLVHLDAIFQDDFRIYFVMEFINGGDLMYHIQTRPFSLNDCKFYAAQVLIALEFLHARGILYRDLKLDNILLTKDGYIKLADYGLSKCEMTGETRTRTFCGTPEFMAPELLLDLPYGFSIDFWAFGVLLYQMLESRSPFYGNNEKETFNSILKGKLTFSAEIDKHGKSLISKLLAPKPTDRIGVKSGEGWPAIKEHPFFSEINWSQLIELRLPVPFKPKFKNYEDVSNFDEVFTNEDVLLTPYPSFVYSKGGNSVAEASSIFADF